MLQWMILLAPAWVASSLLGIMAAPLGCLVLWRRMAFFSDALAHGMLAGIAFATLLHFPMALGMLMVSAIIVALIFVLHDSRLPNDAVLAAISAGLLCFGLIVMSKIPALQSGLVSYLFGDLLALTWDNVTYIVVGIAIGVGLLVLIWRAQIFCVTQEDLAKIAGISILWQRLYFMGLLAGFSIMSLKAVGSLLITALLILPPLTARLFVSSPNQMVVVALLIGQVGIGIGLWASVWLDIGASLAIVMSLSVGFVGLYFYQKLGGVR